MMKKKVYLESVNFSYYKLHIVVKGLGLRGTAEIAAAAVKSNCSHPQPVVNH